jgi:hypothetical protein
MGPHSAALLAGHHDSPVLALGFANSHARVFFQKCSYWNFLYYANAAYSTISFHFYLSASMYPLLSSSVLQSHEIQSLES